MTAAVKLTLAWLALCLVTAASILLAGEPPAPGATQPASLGVAALGGAFAKAYLVMRFFMELGATPWPWRAAFAAWCVGLFVILSAMLLWPA